MWEFPGLKWKLILTNHLNKHDPTKKYKYVSYLVCVSMIFFHSSGSKQIHGAENGAYGEGRGKEKDFCFKKGEGLILVFWILQ